MVKVVICGLGAIGTEILRYLLDRGHSVVGVVDIHPEKKGRTVAELTGLPLGARVSGDIREVPLQDADVAVFATKSKISEISDDVCFAVSNGLDVVTTSEEMAYPNFADPAAGQKIDSLAREKGASVVGAGVNPGFVMDLIPAAVASATKNPSSIHVVRSVDVGRRRRQLQAKTGVGLTKAKFESGQVGGTIGHVGLVESAYLIARSMGKELEDLKHGVFPVLGSEDYVMGVRQFAEGRAGNCQIRLDLEMTMTSADFDVVEVKGDPPLKLRFEKGVFGDSATVALVVHALERIGNAKPGLITVLELPLSAA